MNASDFPYGECECRQGCQCEVEAGPALFNIVRDKKPMKVCSKCTISGDSDRSFLFQREDSIAPFVKYDNEGVMLLTVGIILALNENRDDVD